MRNAPHNAVPEHVAGGEAAARRRWAELRPEVDEALLADITSRIVQRFQPHKVILFGSYVWGRPHEYSDLDLFVIMDSDDRPAVRGAAVHMVAEVPFLPMDVLVYTPDEVKTRTALGDQFVLGILSRGRVLYERDRG